MDPDRALSSRPQASAWDVANNIIFDMEKRFPIASQWIYFLKRLHVYYNNNKSRIRTLNQSPESMSSEDFDGGGLKDYSSQFESEQKELGSLNDESWTRKTEREEMTLSHEHDTEDQSEATSPVPPFKNEDTRASTPRSGFTSVNPSDKRKSTSEAPSLPPQSQTWGYASSHKAAAIRSNGIHDSSNEYSEAQSMRPPTAETATISPAYTRAPVMYGAIPPTNGQMYRDQFVSREGGYVHTTSQIPWQPQQMLLQQQQQQQQQQQTYQANKLEFEHIKQQGQMPMQNFDLHTLQLADDGTFGSDFDTMSVPWLPGFHHAYGSHYEEPYDEAGANMPTN
jgi:hypothetical protein